MRILRQGKIFRFSAGGRWKEGWLILQTDDSSGGPVLHLYKDQGCKKLAKSISVLTVAADIRFRKSTQKYKYPKKTDPRVSLENLIAIPLPAGQKSSALWLCTFAVTDLRKWLLTIAHSCDGLADPPAMPPLPEDEREMNGNGGLSRSNSLADLLSAKTGPDRSKWELYWWFMPDSGDIYPLMPLMPMMPSMPGTPTLLPPYYDDASSAGSHVIAVEEPGMETPMPTPMPTPMQMPTMDTSTSQQPIVTEYKQESTVVTLVTTTEPQSEVPKPLPQPPTTAEETKKGAADEKGQEEDGRVKDEEKSIDATKKDVAVETVSKTQETRENEEGKQTSSSSSSAQPTTAADKEESAVKQQQSDDKEVAAVVDTKPNPAPRPSKQETKSEEENAGHEKPAAAAAVAETANVPSIENKSDQGKSEPQIEEERKAEEKIEDVDIAVVQAPTTFTPAAAHPNSNAAISLPNVTVVTASALGLCTGSYLFGASGIILYIAELYLCFLIAKFFKQ